VRFTGKLGSQDSLLSRIVFGFLGAREVPAVPTEIALSVRPKTQIALEARPQITFTLSVCPKTDLTLEARPR
jgi:hypothetical protein